MSTEIFVHPDCPDCTDVIAQFQADSQVFGDAELLDVTNLPNLKRFLTLRDSLDGFADVRATGKIGVPSKVIDGTTVEFPARCSRPRLLGCWAARRFGGPVLGRGAGARCWVAGTPAPPRRPALPFSSMSTARCR